MNKLASSGRLAKFWWIMAALFAVLWLLIWLIAEPQAAAKAVANNDLQTQSNLTLPKKIDTLTDLSTEVLPLSVESVKQDLRSYADEFKDKAFFEKNKNKWTVQVMDSTTHENIVNYLDIRKDKYQDRDKFYYFRYVDGASKEHYVLIYDLFPNRIIANGVWSERDKRFGLPKDVKIVVKPIKDYLSLIDSYVREENSEEVVIPKEPTVNLKENNKEVAPKPAKTSERVNADLVQNQDDNEQNKAVEQSPARNKTNNNDEQDKSKKAKQDNQNTTETQTPELAKPPTAKPKESKEPKLSQKEEPVVETVEPDPEMVVSLEPEASEGGGQ